MINICTYPNIYTNFQEGTRIGDYVSLGSWIANAFFLSLISIFPILMMTEWGTRLFFIYFDTSILKEYEGGIVVFATVFTNLALLAFSTFTILENFKKHDENSTYREVIDKIKENVADILKGFTTSAFLIIIVICALCYVINSSSFSSIQEREKMIKEYLSTSQLYE